MHSPCQPLPVAVDTVLSVHTVRDETQLTLDKNPHNCDDSFSSGSSLTKGQEDDDCKDSLNELPFSSESTPMTSHECKLTGWP